MAKKKKEQIVKAEIIAVVRNGKCLKCGKPMVKNHLECGSCKKNRRLKSKANRRGKPKNYYL